MPTVTRREFVKHTAIVGVAGVHFAAHADAKSAPVSDPARADAPDQPDHGNGGVPLRWLEGKAPRFLAGATCGVPWTRGTHQPGQSFALLGNDGRDLPVQSWPLAYWPDGSLKWTAHAVGPEAQGAQGLLLKPGQQSATAKAAVTVREHDDSIEVDTGPVLWRLGKRGADLIQSARRDGRTTLRSGRLVGLRQDRPDEPADAAPDRETFTSRIERAAVEQDGPVRAVIRLEGRHETEAGRAWLPFVVRLYFYGGGESVRVMHTFIYDGDEHTDFIKGLGLRFAVPMTDELHNRHVRFGGEGRGLFAEAVRGITGLRRDPGEEVRRAQVDGRATPPIETWDPRVSERMHLIPAWGDFTLSQLSADGFQLRKRTTRGHGWIAAGAGNRAAGVAYAGGISGGVALGMRDFWQRHPTQLDIHGAHTDQAEVTLWLWSPEAPAMDLRFYHDGMGMDTFEKQLDGLEITYEDYEPGFGTPHGIARTNEVTLWALAATPQRNRLADFAEAVATPPQPACSPRHLHEAQVFGGVIWNLPDRSTPARTRIEDTLNFAIDCYQKQIEQRRWYGFWDHGDVMHSYDDDRHVWRYDVGGYAWDNSELSPDLWLWYSFLRTGRADIFRMAEAMTRHTGEVDVYHLGRFKDLGSRHNVQHWGCSCKQLRISDAIYRRFYYFLTADERVGDLMHALVDADKTFLTIDPSRKVRGEPYDPQPRALSVGFGNDWGALAAAWLTEWERTGDAACREKLLNSMRTMGEMPLGLFTHGNIRYDPQTGRFLLRGDPADVHADASHLSAVFGRFEVCAELTTLLDVPAFEEAWIEYCRYYTADRQEREAALGFDMRTGNLVSAHSRLAGYAAHKLQEPGVAEQAWNAFFADDPRWAPRRYVHEIRRLDGPDVLRPIDETDWNGTNDAAQWSLAAIQNLALIGDQLRPDDPRTRPAPAT